MGIHIYVGHIYVGTGHTTHLFQAVLTLQVIGQRVRINLYISKEVHSLVMHGCSINALICLILTTQQ